MSPSIVGIIGIIILLAMFLFKIPVAFAMGIVGLAGSVYLISAEGALNLLAQDFFGTFTSYGLTVVPLFILMGMIAFSAGISRKLYYAAHQWMGFLPGGLSMATIGACAGFAAICGSLSATTATIGSVALPEMKRYNYNMGLAAGSIAAGGTLGVLIPPSVTLIVYGIQAEQSIGKLFIAGIFPGILLAGLFMATIYIICRRNPQMAPVGPKTTFKEKLTSLSGTLETLVVFILVMSGIFFGIFSPTEGGAVGALAVLLVVLAQRSLTWHGFCAALVETAWITCMVLILVLGATIFGRFLAVSQIPFVLTEWLVTLHVPPVVVLIGILLIYAVSGCFVDALPFLLLTIPIFFPVAMNLGFDPIWFGILLIVVSQVGGITPPVGISVYVVSGIAKDVPIETIFKGVTPFVLSFVVCIAILIAFPQISLFLPSFMKY